MSRFFSEKYASLTPYTPGEQPKERQYVKLNTNESPFPPSQKVLSAVAEQCGKLQLYSDPESTALRTKLAEVYGVSPAQVVVTNGSDEVLNFAFMAFADETHPLAFADITYGFYLYHMVFINIALEFFGPLTLNNAALSIIVIFVLTVVASIASQKLIENPAAKLFSKKIKE